MLLAHFTFVSLPLLHKRAHRGRRFIRNFGLLGSLYWYFVPSFEESD